MVGNIETRRPFENTVGYSKFIPSGATDIQLVRMPWQTPVQKPGYLTLVAITNPVGTAGALKIWDQDLSSTTPPTAGSAGASLFPLEFGASAASGSASKTTVYTADQLAKIPIVGGLTAQSTQPGVTVMFNVTYI